MNNDEDKDDDDSSYVPESLREIFADADKKLEQELADALLENENNTAAKKKINDNDEMSPPLEAPPSKNPAALLTHGTAKVWALDGVTPFLEKEGSSTTPSTFENNLVVNLQFQLDEAVEEEEEEEELPVHLLPVKELPVVLVPGSTPTVTPSSPGDNYKHFAGDQIQVNVVARSSGGKMDDGRVELQAGALQLDSLSSPRNDPFPLEDGEQQQQQQQARPTTPNSSPSCILRGEQQQANVLLQGTPTSHFQLQNPQLAEEERTTGDDLSPHRPKEISFVLPSSSSEATNLPTTSPMMASPSMIQRQTRSIKSNGNTNSNTKSARNNPKNTARKSPPISNTSSLLRGTSASRGKLGFRNLTMAASTATAATTGGGGGETVVSPWKGRKELTSPDKVSSRLLRGTAASTSRARFSKPLAVPQTNINNIKTAGANTNAHPRPLPTQSVLQQQQQQQPGSTTESVKVVGPAERPFGAAAVSETQTEKLKRLEMHQQKEKERKRHMQQKMRKRLLEQKEKRDKMQATSDRAKSQREKLKAMEQERVQKLRKEIEEKEARAQQRLAGKEKENSRPTILGGRESRGSSAVSRSKNGKFKPTIPIAPNFRTDQRLKMYNTDRAPESLMIPMAQSDAILRQGLRCETRPPTSEVAQQQQQRHLTIPKAPRLSTCKRHAGKNDGVPLVIPKIHLWESELRTVSSPLASDRSESSRLTIPHSPKFHEIKARPRPKSTAEKEEEEMEYFNSHPFKAKPVMTHDASSVGSNLTGSKPPPARAVTTPSPFQFRTDQRSSAVRCRLENTPEGERSTRSQLFKARPAPKFNKTPLTGKRPAANRSATTPEPFHFQSTSRSHRKTPQSEGAEIEESLFKARPMPNFSRPTGLTLQRRMVIRNLESSQHGKDDGTVSDFSELPVEVHDGAGIHTHQAFKDEETESKQHFYARPMPNFKTVAIPVKERNPEKTRLSPSHLGQEMPEPEPPAPFRARKVPKSLVQPSIPVKQRDPSKLRSPDFLLRASPPHQALDEPQANPAPVFRARKVPKSLVQPSISVKHRDPTKLRSPEIVLRASPPQNVLEDPQGDSGPVFRARKVPKTLVQPSIPVKPRDPTKLRSPEIVLRASPPHQVLDEPQAEPAPVFRARKVPKSLVQPTIPVKQRDPTKLRSPEIVVGTSSCMSSEANEFNRGFEARKMPKFDNRFDGSPMKTVYTTTPTLTPPKWETTSREEAPPERDTAKERLRQRLKGRQSKPAAGSKGTSSRFATSTVRTRLQRVAPVVSPEPGVPTSIHVSSPNSGDRIHASKPSDAVEEIPTATQRDSPAIPTLDGENRRPVQAADPDGSRCTTPRAGTGAGPLSVEELHKMTQASREAEAMKMAVELQRAAEDELSFHGSRDSRSFHSSDHDGSHDMQRGEMGEAMF